MKLQANKLLSPKSSAIIVAILAGWSYGYSTSIISGLSNTLVINSYYPTENNPNTISLLQGLLTSCIMIGGIIGSLIGPLLANRYGRRLSLFICGCITVFSCSILGSINSYISTVVLRGLVGIGMGMTGTVAPLYMAEISSVELRGSLGVLFEVGLCNGMLIAMFINYIMSPGLNGDINAVLGRWNIGTQFALGAVPGILLCILPYWLRETNIKRYSLVVNTNMITNTSTCVDDNNPIVAIHTTRVMPSSPMMQALGSSIQSHNDIQLSNIKSSDAYDHIDKHKDTVHKTDNNNVNNIDEFNHVNIDSSTLDHINDTIKHESSSPTPIQNTSNDKQHKLIKRTAGNRSTISNDTNISITESSITTFTSDNRSAWILLFTTRDGLYYILLACLLCATDLFTGINALFFYSPTIFQQAGLNNVLLYTFATVGIWNLVTCIVPYLAVDRFGRRPLFLCSLYIMTVSMLLLSLDYLIFPSTVSSILSIIFVLMFLIGWQLGVGALFFLLANELYPDSIRSECLIFTNILGRYKINITLFMLLTLFMLTYILFQGYDTGWVCNITMSFVFPLLVSEIGIGYTFLFHVAVCAVCSILAYLYLPETKNMTFASTSVIYGD